MWKHISAVDQCDFTFKRTRANVTIIALSLSLSLRSISRRRGRLHELTPWRSIQSMPPCRREAEIERVQIVLKRSASVYRFCVASLWEDPVCRPEELENGLDWCRHDKLINERQLPFTDLRHYTMYQFSSQGWRSLTLIHDLLFSLSLY